MEARLRSRAVISDVHFQHRSPNLGIVVRSFVDLQFSDRGQDERGCRELAKTSSAMRVIPALEYGTGMR